MKNTNNKFIIVLVLAAVVILIISIGFTFFSLLNLSSRISGYVTTTSTAEVNLTVETIAAINFTTSLVNYGSGRVNSGSTSAALTTFGTNNVTGGNWTLRTAGGLRLENIGDVNVSINLTSNKAAAAFIGGASVTPVFQWNITNFEANSCLNKTGTGTVGLNTDVFYNVNTTTANYCPLLNYLDSADVIRIDFNITIPTDSLTGALSAIITATADTTTGQT